MSGSFPERTNPDRTNGGRALRAAAVLGLTAALAWGAGACESASGPPEDTTRGRVMVVVATHGPDIDPDGYRVDIDDGHSLQSQPNATLTVDGVQAGQRLVALDEVADNCAVVGDNPKQVSVDFWHTAQASFQVSCEPLVGDLVVSTETTGEDPDPDGYEVAVDGETVGAIGPEASLALEDVRQGSRSVELRGVAGNCAVVGENPRDVEVTADEQATAAFEVACEARVGDLEVDVRTTGVDLDGDGYELRVDGTARGSVAIDGTATLAGIPEGTRSLQLADVAPNCDVEGPNPQEVEVAFGETVAASFAVTCDDATGELEVSVSTSGSPPDPDGYTVRVDGVGTRDVSADDSVLFPDLPADRYTVRLQGVAGHCEVQGSTTRNATVRGGDRTRTAFSVECSDSTPTGRIFFDSDRTGDFDIYSIAPNGGGQARLTSDAAHEYAVEVSPDGRQIVYQNGQQLVVADADGSNPRALPTIGRDGQPAWSPDGTWIVFSSDPDGDREIYIRRADGTGGAQQLTFNDRLDDFPHWGAGGRIAFVSDRDGSLDVWTVNPNSPGDQRNATPGSPGVDKAPAFSPNGSQIAFESDRADPGNNDVYVMNADGSNVRRLTTASGVDGQPAWSPDGRWIAFDSDRLGAPHARFEIYIIEVASGRILQVTSAGSWNTAPSWSR